VAVQRTVLIVDDDAGFRSCARRLLEASGWRVLGEAPDGLAGIAAAAELAPDVVLLDIGLPDQSGFDVAQRLAGADRPPAVVLASALDPDDVADAVERAPVRGFVPKERLSAATFAAALASG
jgi:DNA-binding NarL/FixJ family response regulator